MRAVTLTLAGALTLVGCGSETTGSEDGAVETSDTSRPDSAPEETGVEETAPAEDTTAGNPDTSVAAGPWFSQTMPWDRPVADLAPDPRSDAMIAALEARGGWGNGDVFQIDFSIVVLTSDGDTPYREFTPNDDFYEDECDHVPVPVPPGGALEGEDGYQCESDGDCHLIVLAPEALYEMWRAHLDGSGFSGGCLAVWDRARAWPESLRGEGCTSADAAGLPIAPLLFSAGEVAGGRIEHPIRFILPNDRIAHRQYVRPATHATGAASAETDGMPYGVRLRLRADYPLDDLPNDGARVVARALQEYGMILADGGQIALTAASDRGAEVGWDGLLGSRDLAELRVTDFEVVDLGATYQWTGDCERNL